VNVQGNSLRIRDEIRWENKLTLVEVDAQVDGTFYPVTGTAMADEVAYQVRGEAVEGIGRCEGVASLRERITISESGELVLELQIQVGKLEVPAGTARFKQQP
jgi:hypothetical protein